MVVFNHGYWISYCCNLLFITPSGKQTEYINRIHPFLAREIKMRDRHISSQN